MGAGSDPTSTRLDYLTFLDNLYDGYVETDGEGLITFANLPFSSNLGYDDRNALYGNPIWKLTRDKYEKGVYAQYKLLLDGKQSSSLVRVVFTGRNDKEFIGEAAITPLTEDGIVTGSRSIIRNITQTFKADKVRAYEKDLFDALLQQAPIAIAVVNKKKKVTLVNVAFEKLFGYARDEVIGKHLKQFDLSTEVLKKIDECAVSPQEGTSYVTGQKIRQDGSSTDVEIFVQPFFAGSINYGYLVFYNDITEQRKAELELKNITTAHRAVLDTLQDSYFEADLAGYLTFVNQKMVESTRYDNKNELVGKHFRHLIDRDNRITLLKRFKQMLATSQASSQMEIRYRTKDGGVFSSEVVAVPMVEAGKVVGTRGIIRDISVRVKAEEILRSAKIAAEMRAGELASINRLAAKLNYSLNLRDILSTACEELTRILPVQFAGIALFDDFQAILEVQAFYAVTPDEGIHTGRILNVEDHASIQKVINEPRTAHKPGLVEEPALNLITELFGLSSKGSPMIVPLISRGKAQGIIGTMLDQSVGVLEDHHIELAETAASQIASAIENAQLHARTEKALDLAERDLEIGKEIQSGFFPQFHPQLQGWDFSTFFRAARQVSGDFYDIFRIRDTPMVLFAIADVCDKGVGAALFMVLLRSLIRSKSEEMMELKSPDEMLGKLAINVNNYIVTNHSQSNMFATLVLCMLDTRASRLYYVNAGHDSPLVINTMGQIRMKLDPTGPAIGFSNEIPYEVGSIDFNPGDTLISYTDGFTEARDSEGRFYSEKRFISHLSREWPSAFSIVKHLEAEINQHTQERYQADDLTLLILRKEQVNEVVSHTFSRRAEMVNLPLFRNFADEVCQLLGMKESDAESIKLATDEICANLIMHGYQGMEPGEIQITIEKRLSEVQVHIEDFGHPFDPFKPAIPSLTDNLEEREIGGLGLYLVREIADEIKYKSESGCNCITFKKGIDVPEYK